MLIVINYKMTTFFSNDNSNCNTIRLEGNGNGNWYREYGNGNALQSISN